MVVPHNSNDYDLEDILLSESNALLISDLVSDMTELAFEYADDEKIPILYTGGAIMHEALSIAEKLGYLLPDEKMFDKFKRNLSDRDTEALLIRTGVDNYGFENFINMYARQHNIPNEYMSDFKNYIDEMLNHSNRRDFKNKVNVLEEEFQYTHEVTQYLEDQLRINFLYSIILDENARIQADYFNDNRNVEGYVIGDNNLYNAIQKYMDKPKQLQLIEKEEQLIQIKGLDKKLIDEPVLVLQGQMYALTQNHNGEVIYYHFSESGEPQNLSDKYNMDTIEREIEYLIDLFKNEIEDYYKNVA